MYILLLTYYTPSSSDETKWEIYETLEQAKVRLENIKKQSEHYRNIPVLVGPCLIQSVIFKIEQLD